MKLSLGSLMLFFMGMLTRTTAQQVEARLKADLFSSYDKRLLPTHNESLNVNIQMSLSSLREMDFFQGSIKMNAWLFMHWVDPRLVWNPLEYGNISKFRVHSSEVFVPDITLYNSHSPSKTMSDDISTLMTNHGTVYYTPPVAIEAACSLDLKDYPYDSHICRLKWGSWVFSSMRISVTPASDTIDLNDYHAHPVWELVNTSAVKNVVSYPCCAEVYEDISFHLTVRRRESHGRIASAVIATWLILIVFLIGPSSAGERIIFAGFVFVALVVLSAALSAEVPAYSMTRLGRFLIGGMLINAVVIIINGLIYRFYPKDQPGHMKEGDGTISRVFLFIDIGAFLGTTIILAITTGALFA
ncbi:neuronal acetylcholine receptor subunit alpha-2-like [Strongylocentrotus purpuratus]|uniref:Neurotransmitter-gated ion-channel ligand-binding domain-containing protein n=1 Tax=Strongylocentrotus purpuratus TaxID=7668 RepID=A0A7M7N4C1_STRPU|nr:neuronal acetylcholine receptor subunit alpha-2-like [Strongylocentrotus purpuratus]